MAVETMSTFILLNNLDLEGAQYDHSLLEEMNFSFEPFPELLLKNRFLPETVLRDKKYFPYLLKKNSQPYSIYNDSDTRGILGEINSFLLACWLYDHTKLRLEGYMWFLHKGKLSLQTGGGFRGHGYHSLRSNFRSKSLQELDFEAIIRMWKKLLEIFPEEGEGDEDSNQRAPLQIALFFALKGLLAKEFGLRQLLFWASLEAIFCPIRGPISRNCSCRISYLFGEDKQNRQRLFRRCQDSYRLRSTFVHGNLNSYEKRTPGFAKGSNDYFLEDILSASLMTIFAG